METYLWVERYRPTTIEDCVLPFSIKNSFRDIVKTGESQNLLLSGNAGCGKTTIAKALCNELGTDYIMINCSEDGNIDTLRTKIRNFASTVSISGDKKVVILDEFDYSNAQSMQPALRGFIEEFADNCRFILTCNFKNRIIEPIHSRCTNISFNIPKDEKPKLAAEFMERLKYILDKESIPYEEKVLARLIMKHFPDFRRVINEIQRYSVAGTIDIGILSDVGNVQVKDLVKYMREKDFTSARKWAVENLDNAPSELLRKIYDSLYENLTPLSIPQAILILAEYQYKSAFVADQEINLVACIVELMMNCEIK
ncbi:DNA polymerase [Candidatus Pacearchaeota archaeon]|jgi:DNA polymerase III delta prime subunit|nr:DNA polymerase [Candidatus Pacearchaeota archaeon]|tara:strand:- start:7939 stop:8874 length:936 start_codon:yes stop_codon:yes gene_type:complete